MAHDPFADVADDAGLEPAGTAFGGPTPASRDASEREVEVVSPVVTDPFAEFVDEGTVGQREAFARGAVSGVVRQGSFGAGAATGFRTGLGLPIPHPVAKGAAIAATTVIGAAGGMFVGEVINEPLARLEFSIRDLEELPEDVRGFGAAGETFGGVLTLSGGVAAVARQGFRFAPSKVGSYLNNILEAAGTRTKTFLFNELKMGAAAATAGGLAVELVPEQPRVRFASEIVGGSYPFIVNNAAKGIFGFAKSTFNRFTDAGRKTRAGQVLQEFFELSGEDPQTFANLLAQTDFPGVKTSAAQKIGQPAAAHFEAELDELLRPFGEERKLMAKNSLKAITNMMVLLRGTGDPAALRKVATIRYRFFKGMLQARVNQATDLAIVAAEKITQDTPGARSTISKEIGTIVEKSLKDARFLETRTWSLVDSSVPMDPEEILATWSKLLGQVLPRKVQDLPEVITGTLSDLKAAVRVLQKVDEGKGKELAKGELKAAQKMMSSGFFIKLRDEALSQVRQLDRLKFPNERRILGELAEAVLVDLDAGFEAATALTATTREAYNTARDFSHALNEVYTRTFIGAARATGPTGARRVPPEILAREALATGEELGALRLRELREGIDFLVRQGGPVGANAEQQLELLMDLQGRFIRLAAAESIDPLTGRVNAKKLTKFLSDNEEMIDGLSPELRANFETAAKTEEGLRAVELATPLRTAKTGEVTLSANIEREAAFTRILGVESGAKAVEGAISSSTPTRHLSRMARLARRGGDEAVQGFRGAIWDYALQRATDLEGNLSLRVLAGTLTEPLGIGFPSLIQFMEVNNIMMRAQAEDVRQLITRARTIGEAMEVRPIGDPLIGGDAFDIPEMMLDGALRISGAQVGRQIAGATGGGTVQTPGITASLAKRVLGRIPQLKVRDILKDAFLGAPLVPGDPNDPYGLLRHLLTRPATAEQAFEFSRQLHAYAFMAGYTFLSDEDNFLIARDAREEDPFAAVEDTPEDEAADEATEEKLRGLPPEGDFEDTGVSIGQEQNFFPEEISGAPEEEIAEEEPSKFKKLVSGLKALIPKEIRP